MRYTCERCGESFSQSGRGRSPRFCSLSCRSAAHRSSVQVFPRKMTLRQRWARADGKRPIMVDGSPASSTDPGTWAKFRDVQDGSGDGFGFMLGGGIGCYDIDHCVADEVIESWASKFVAGLPEPVLFTEFSVSGTGLHVFVEAPEAPGSRLGGVERYSRERFIRCTGNSVSFV